MATLSTISYPIIIDEDGNPGPNYSYAAQYSADVTGSSTFQLSPAKKTSNRIWPVPLTGGASDVCVDNGICTLAQAEASEDGLAKEYPVYLLPRRHGTAGPNARFSGLFDLFDLGGGQE